VFDHAGFFLTSSGEASSQRPRILSMNQSNSTIAKQIADGASAFEQKKTDHAPKGVTVVWEQMRRIFVK
jgi:hypothetical protein